MMKWSSILSANDLISQFGLCIRIAYGDSKPQMAGFQPMYIYSVSDLKKNLHLKNSAGDLKIYLNFIKEGDSGLIFLCKLYITEKYTNQKYMSIDFLKVNKSRTRNKTLLELQYPPCPSPIITQPPITAFLTSSPQINFACFWTSPNKWKHRALSLASFTQLIVFVRVIYVAAVGSFWLLNNTPYLLICQKCIHFSVYRLLSCFKFW